MSLPFAVQGATTPAATITWEDADGTGISFTNATLTGTIHDLQTRKTRAITGTLTPGSGTFAWAYSAADVENAGKHLVQFTATYSVGPSPARSLETVWEVRKAREAD